MDGRWNGQYLEVGYFKPGDKVSVAFPIAERTQRETIGGRPYTLTLKGHDVVAIDPPGKYRPYYERDKYRKGKMLWKTVQRFVSDQTLLI